MTLFPSLIIEKWEYQNEKPTTEVSPYPAKSFIKIQDDDDDILFRIIKQNKKLTREKIEQQKRKSVSQKPEKIQFVPAPIHKMSVKELKEHLKALGLNTDGQKADLIKRYEKFAKGK